MARSPIRWESAPDAGSTIVKLFDFGLSRLPRMGFGPSATDTGDGVILGTPGYMAPEQSRGEVVTPAADIFSLGCLLYEAFYGTRAFDGRTKAAQYFATLNHDPQPDPLRRRDDVELADLIQFCLHKEASQRPQSAASIAKQLRHRRVAVDHGASPIEQTPRAVRLPRRWLLVVGGGGVAGAIAGAIFLRETVDNLANIRSIAILSFSDESSPSRGSTTVPSPIGDAHRGDQLAALLVHELTRLSSVTVPRFRPLMAETPGEFRSIGELLEVDALVAGSMRTVRQGSKEFLHLDIQIVSAKTGGQLWGKQIQTESGDNLLEQSKLATEIASVIGRTTYLHRRRDGTPKR